MRKAIVVVLLAVALAGCTETNRARYEKRMESEHGYGVMRTVTAYSSTGEQIGQWHGKIDVDYVVSDTGGGGSNERVDILVFDGETVVDRIIISGATVIVDEEHE